LKIDPPAPSATPLQRTPATGAATTTASAAQAASTAATAAARPKEAAQPSAHVHTLPSAVGGSDFDAARVAAIREDIRAGRYQIRPERIADGLLASVRDLLDPQAEAQSRANPDPEGRQ
jgi:negative regulator of flagellin synthesis FlgM